MNYCKNLLVPIPITHSDRENASIAGIDVNLLKLGLSNGDNERLQILYKDKPIDGPFNPQDAIPLETLIGNSLD